MNGDALAVGATLYKMKIMLEQGKHGEIASFENSRGDSFAQRNLLPVMYYADLISRPHVTSHDLKIARRAEGEKPRFLSFMKVQLTDAKTQ